MKHFESRPSEEGIKFDNINPEFKSGPEEGVIKNLEGIVDTETKFTAKIHEKTEGLISKFGKTRNILMGAAAASLLNIGAIAFLDQRYTYEPNDDSRFSQKTNDPALDEKSIDFLKNNHGTIIVNATGFVPGGNYIPIEMRFSGDQKELDEIKAQRFTKSTLPRSIAVTFDSVASIPGDPGNINIGYRRIQSADGNHFFVRQKTVDGKGITEVIAYAPSSYSNVPASKEYSRDLDLTSVGGPKLEKIVRGEANVPFARVGKDSAYNIYTTSENSAEVVEEFHKKKEMILFGVEEAERLFGFRSGESVKHINIAPKGFMINAVSMGETVLLSENWLESKTKNMGREIVVDDLTLMTITKHEALHSIDARFGNKLSQNLLKSMGTIPYNLANKLNESSFIGISIGGHAGDNSHEFFASFANAITDLEWDNSVAKLDGKEKIILLSSLISMESSLALTDAEFAKLRKEKSEQSFANQSGPLPELDKTPFAVVLREKIGLLSSVVDISKITEAPKDEDPMMTEYRTYKEQADFDEE